MENSKYVIFDILGVKKDDCQNSFVFDKDAECIINNDKYISKIQVSSDISKVIFCLHNSLEISENNVLGIVNYLSLYLGNMMIALLKNSLKYSSVLLKPTIHISELHLLGDEDRFNDHIGITDSLLCRSKFKNGNDILFLLLQGDNIIQKYMAMYAYLMCLVKEVYSSQRESQKQVVKYISDNCSRVGINLRLSLSTRPGVKINEKDDQFTVLRNKIAHPANINANVNVSENAINQLASIICCAIEDISL